MFALVRLLDPFDFYDGTVLVGERIILLLGLFPGLSGFKVTFGVP